MSSTPTADRQEGQQPAAPAVGVVFQAEPWLRLVRELGSFGLVVFLVVFWVTTIQPSIAQMQQAQIEQTQAIKQLTEIVKELKERDK